MGLSDPSAIEQWLRSRGQSDVIRPHAWNFLQDGPGGEDLNDKPSARCVPHVDSSGVSHFPGSRDLYRPQWTVSRGQRLLARDAGEAPRIEIHRLALEASEVVSAAATWSFEADQLSLNQMRGAGRRSPISSPVVSRVPIGTVSRYQPFAAVGGKSSSTGGRPARTGTGKKAMAIANR